MKAIKPWSDPLSIKLRPPDAQKLSQVSHERDTPKSTLARQWIHERLCREAANEAKRKKRNG